MSPIKHFSHCKSLDEIKSKYHKLTQERLPRENHPGDFDLMNYVDQEYQQISERSKFKELSEEVQKDFLAYPNIVKELVRRELKLEMCGSWLWVSGNTFEHTDTLKELGLKYSPNKRMWYHRPSWSRSYNSTPMSFDYIRSKWGSDREDKEFVFDTPRTNDPAGSNIHGGQ